MYVLHYFNLYIVFVKKQKQVQVGVRVLDHERNNEGSMLLYNLAATKNSKMKMFTQDKSREKQRSPAKIMLIAFELIQKGSLSEH